METFMNLPNFAESKVLILPVPYEQTTSYKKGTINGPNAIIKASNELELYDYELKSEPYKVGIVTLKPIIDFKKLESIKTSKFLIALGGEHTITLPLIKRFDQQDLSILHLDAHADLKDSFEGKKLNHASVLRRISDFNDNITQVGVRSLDKEELTFIKRNKINTFFVDDFDIKKIVKTLNKNVYITIDLDVFDPSVLPDVGTPEPNGLQFKQVTDLLKEVFDKKNVVGCDVVELCPSSQIVSSYTAAKLVYKLIGFYSKNLD